jgi:nucleotide-binding universal stress UspA family protein
LGGDQPKRAILVGLSTPANMLPRLEIAKLLAEEVGAEVVPFVVLTAAQRHQPELADRFYEAARQCAVEEAHLGEPLRLEANSLEQGVIQAARSTNPRFVLLGYLPRQEGDTGSVKAFERAAQRVVKTVRRHLIVTKFGERREFRRLLLPLTSTINLGPLGDLARALIRPPDSEIALAHVLPDEATTSDYHSASAFLRAAAETCGLVDRCQFRVEAHADLVEGILELSRDYDAVLLGAPRIKSLSERLFGTIADQVATWARANVFIVRAGE